MGSIGPTFFLAAAVFNFVLQISSLVAKKEHKLRQVQTFCKLELIFSWTISIFCQLYLLFLRFSYLAQAMNMMGLYDSASWLSWLTWEGLITLLSSLFIVLFGMLFRFHFFLKNSFAVVFLPFFLVELNMLRILDSSN